MLKELSVYYVWLVVTLENRDKVLNNREMNNPTHKVT